MTSLLRKKFGQLVDGLELYGELPVGIPVEIHRLELDIARETPYPFPNEMILRLISYGISTVQEMASFLGVDEELVLDFALDEVQAQMIYQSKTGFRLTSLGYERLGEMMALKIERRNLTIGWDTLSGGLSEVPRDSRTLEQIKEYDSDFNAAPQMLPSKPDKKVKREKFDLDSINRLLGKGSSAIRLVNQKSTGDLRYRSAHLLVFSDPSASQVELRIIADGEEAIEYQQVINTESFRDSMGIKVERQTEDAVDATEAALRAFETSAPDSLKAIGEISGSIDFSEDEAEATLIAEPPKPGVPQEVKQFSVFEHPEFLAESLKSARQRLLVVSPWITSKVVDVAFLRNLEGLLSRKVEVDVVYGIKGDERSSQKAIRELCNLSNRFENFRFYQHENNHSKILIVDDVVITSSFNWLSFKGDASKTFRREEGTLVKGGAYADQVYIGWQSVIYAECRPACNSL